MSSGSSSAEEQSIELIFDVQSIESSDDPPREEWSSLLLEIPEISAKRKAFAEGLYDIGSGLICAKYIPCSDSSVFRHPYYNYPAVTDPGIEDALFKPQEKHVFPDDGQELYLALCKEMNQCPVGIFYRSLLSKDINLQYYGVHPQGVRAMAKALSYNKTVETITFTDNFLSLDACFHLNEMLASNSTLRELNLEGCRIGPEGAKTLFTGVILNRTLKCLNLNRNQLGDDGGEIFAAALYRGIDLERIYLSYNQLGSRTGTAIAAAFESYNRLTHIDLSWNNFFSPLGTCGMLTAFSNSLHLQNLNLSWNSMAGPRLAAAIKIALASPELTVLDLSNNKFQNEAIDIIVADLRTAKKLHVLDLSFNPLSTDDAMKVINVMKMNAVKIKNLYMKNITVSKEFVQVVDRIHRMKAKKNAVITYGDVASKIIALGPDPREIVLNRAEFLSKKPKRNKADVALIFHKLWKDKYQIMDSKDFITAVKANGGGMLDEDLLEEIVNSFPAPRTKKSKRINIETLVEYVTRKWPDRRLPPTPPPPPPPPPPEPTAAKAKEKGKGKKK